MEYCVTLAYKNQAGILSFSAVKAASTDQMAMDHVPMSPIKSLSPPVDASALLDTSIDFWDEKFQIRPPFGTDDQLKLVAEAGSEAEAEDEEQMVTGCERACSCLLEPVLGTRSVAWSSKTKGSPRT